MLDKMWGYMVGLGKIGIKDVVCEVGVVFLIVFYVLNGIVLILNEVCMKVFVVVQCLGYFVECKVKVMIVVLGMVFFVVYKDQLLYNDINFFFWIMFSGLVWECEWFGVKLVFYFLDEKLEQGVVVSVVWDVGVDGIIVVVQDSYEFLNGIR